MDELSQASLKQLSGAATRPVIVAPVVSGAPNWGETVQPVIIAKEQVIMATSKKRFLWFIIISSFRGLSPFSVTRIIPKKEESYR